jgi:predicted ATP-dependent serine protease
VLPQQITNQFSSSERDQKALGKLIAAGAINYEMAQLRNRVAGGEPGIGATQILMKESGNMLSSHYPNLTVTARNEAQNEINRIIGQGLRAREKVGVSPSQLLPGMHKESESTQENKVSDPWGIR